MLSQLQINDFSSVGCIGIEFIRDFPPLVFVSACAPSLEGSFKGGWKVTIIFFTHFLNTL